MESETCARPERPILTVASLEDATFHDVDNALRELDEALEGFDHGLSVGNRRLAERYVQGRLSFVWKVRHLGLQLGKPALESGRDRCDSRSCWRSRSRSQVGQFLECLERAERDQRLARSPSMP